MKSTQPDQVVASKQTQNSNPRLDWSGVQRVVLVRLRSIGDTVLMTPCLEALKTHSPSIELTVVSEPLSAPILEEHPMVDRLIVAEPSLAARLRLVAQLRSGRFDVAFNLHGGTTATLLAAMSGARHTIGYHGYRQSWMLNLRAPAPDVILGRERVHSVEQQLALLSWAGVKYPERPRLALPVSEKATSSIKSRLGALGVSNFALISPSAAFEAKQWPAERFARVADHLSDAFGLSSVVIAGPGHEQTAREVCRTAKSAPAAVTGLSLKELTALMALSRLYVGNDSGPMHLAAATGRPLVAIFGPSNSTVWRPWTDAAYRIVESSDGRPRAIDQIPLEEVLEAVDDVVKSAAVAASQAL